MDAVERTGSAPMETVYDGFISYSHAADDLLAPRLQSGLQRFAKPWWKRRAVRIFRDESSLSANPHLWSSITEALDTSGWFVLLLSPDAAVSEWVNQEIAYWVENRDPKKILPVVTDGTFGWADDVMTGTAVPEALQGVFTEEPRWVDVRWAKGEEQLDLQDPRFADAVADIASTIRGVPKDDLASEEVRQHRRTIRTAWAAGIVVLLFGIAAAVGAVVAVGQSNEAQDQREEAETQRDAAEQLAVSEAVARAAADAAAAAEAEARVEAEAQRQVAEDERDSAQRERNRADQQTRTARAEAFAAQAQGVLEDDPELAVLLASQALDLEARSAALAAMHTALQQHRTIFQVAPTDVGLGSIQGGMSPDGKLVAVHGAFGNLLEVWEVDTGNLLWTLSTADEVFLLVDAAFSLDGEVVAYVLNEEDLAKFELRVFDGRSGALVKTVPTPRCSSWKYYPNIGSPYLDLSRPIVWTVDDDCDHFGTPEGQLGLLDPETGTFTVIRAIRATPFTVVGVPTQDAAGRLIAIDDARGADGLVIDVGTGEVVFGYDGGMATLSADGRRLLAGSDADSQLELWDIETGERLWRFVDVPVFTRAFFSADETLVYGTSFDGSTYVIDADSGFEVMRLSGHTGNSRKAVMSVDKTRVATFSRDGTVRVWDIGRVAASEGPTYITNSRVMEHQSARSADLAGGVAAVFAGSAQREENQDWETVVIDLQTGDEQFRVSGGSPAFSANGSHLAYRVVDEVALTEADLRGLAEAGVYRRVGGIRIVEALTGAVVTEIALPCHTYFVDGDVVAGTGCEGMDDVPAWSRIYDIEFSPDGTLLAVADGADSWLRVMDVTSGDVVFSDTAHGAGFHRKASFVRFSPNGAHLVAIFDGAVTAVRVYELETFALVAELDLGVALSLDFTSDSATLVVGDFGGRLHYVDTSDWSVIGEVDAHQGVVEAVSINPSQTLVATAAENGIRVWKMSDRSLVTEVAVESAAVRDLAFLDDTHLLAIPAFAPIAFVITLDPSELAEIGRAAVTRAFTETECATYGIHPCPTTLEALRDG